MEKIKVSVIIPVYNVELYLNECLDSIINQSLKDIEIICINDGSTDNSSNILQEYQKKDNRIKIINQSNHGQGFARNVALSRVIGDYVYFMDADDYLELTALEELYVLAEENLLDLVIFKLINFHDETGETFQTSYYDMDFLRDLVGSNVFNYHDVKDKVFEIAVSPPGKLFKKSLISDIRFTENLIFEDNPFFVEAILNAKRVIFYDKYLYYRRIRNNSTTGSSSRYVDAIPILNEIINITKKLNLFNEFSGALYYRKINQILYRYGLSNNSEKQNFFFKMKEDFLLHKDEYESDIAFINLNPRLKNAFYSCISSDSYKEFDLHLTIFDYKNEISFLTKNNEDLSNKVSNFENQCFNLKKDNDILSKKIQDIGSNDSSKITYLENYCNDLKNENECLLFDNLKLKDSNNYFKNSNKKLLIEQKNLKSTKSYKLSCKYNNIKNRLF